MRHTILRMFRRANADHNATMRQGARQDTLIDKRRRTDTVGKRRRDDTSSRGRVPANFFKLHRSTRAKERDQVCGGGFERGSVRVVITSSRLRACRLVHGAASYLCIDARIQRYRRVAALYRGANGREYVRNDRRSSP